MKFKNEKKNSQKEKLIPLKIPLISKFSNWNFKTSDPFSVWGGEEKSTSSLSHHRNVLFKILKPKGIDCFKDKSIKAR